MTAAWNFLLHVVNTIPAWLAAALIGWAGSIAITQPAKFLMPARWDPELRAVAARALASLSAFLATGFAYQALAPDGSAAGLLVTALLTGLWSPIAYALLIRGLRRSPRLAWIADVLSGDVRGAEPKP